jgi:hypothetical protein
MVKGGDVFMKTIKLPLCFLLCAVALVVIIGCPGILGMLGDTTFKLIIENKTNTNLYVEFINTYVWNSCGVNANRTVVLAHDYEDHKPIDDLTLRGSIEFYYLIGDDNWPRPGKFIKQIADINSVITVTADNRDQYDLGEVIYKLVITDAMLGIGGAQVGGSDEESDENTSETEAENTGEINTDENDGDNNENENN